MPSTVLPGSAYGHRYSGRSPGEIATGIFNSIQSMKQRNADQNQRERVWDAVQRTQGMDPQEQQQAIIQAIRPPQAPQPFGGSPLGQVGNFVAGIGDSLNPFTAARSPAPTNLDEAIMGGVTQNAFQSPGQLAQTDYLNARTGLTQAQTEQVGIPTAQEQAMTGYYDARTGLTEAQTRAAGMPDQPTVSNQIAALMAKEEPGSQRWMELGKIQSSSTNITTNVNPASATERTDIAGGRASLDALDNLKTLFDSGETRTGPIVGRADPTIGLFGWTSAEQENFMAATTSFKNAIIKEITGAQMGEAEATRIMKQVPDITDPSERWKAKWEQSRLNLEMLQKRRLEILGQSGLRVPGGATKAGKAGPVAPTTQNRTAPAQWPDASTMTPLDSEIQGMSDEELQRIIDGGK